MKELDFKPHKSKNSFRKNYKLHDLAEQYGKNLLIQWGFEFIAYGKDKRYEKVWEQGKDKPDLIIQYKGKKALLDWKAKHKEAWLINKRAVDAYKRWQKELAMPVIICFSVFDDSNHLKSINFACLGKHPYRLSKNKAWDKNLTVVFEKELPAFSKTNLLQFI